MSASTSSIPPLTLPLYSNQIPHNHSSTTNPSSNVSNLSSFQSLLSILKHGKELSDIHSSFSTSSNSNIFSFYSLFLQQFISYLPTFMISLASSSPSPSSSSIIFYYEIKLLTKYIIKNFPLLLSQYYDFSYLYSLSSFVSQNSDSQSFSSSPLPSSTTSSSSTLSLTLFQYLILYCQGKALKVILQVALTLCPSLVWQRDSNGALLIHLLLRSNNLTEENFSIVMNAYVLSIKEIIDDEEKKNKNNLEKIDEINEEIILEEEEELYIKNMNLYKNNNTNIENYIIENTQYNDKNNFFNLLNYKFSINIQNYLLNFSNFYNIKSLKINKKIKKINLFNNFNDISQSNTTSPTKKNNFKLLILSEDSATLSLSRSTSNYYYPSATTPQEAAHFFSSPPSSSSSLSPSLPGTESSSLITSIYQFVLNQVDSIGQLPLHYILQSSKTSIQILDKLIELNPIALSSYIESLNIFSFYLNQNKIDIKVLEVLYEEYNRYQRIEEINNEKVDGKNKKLSFISPILSSSPSSINHSETSSGTSTIEGSASSIITNSTSGSISSSPLSFPCSQGLLPLHYYILNFNEEYIKDNDAISSSIEILSFLIAQYPESISIPLPNDGGLPLHLLLNVTAGYDLGEEQVEEIEQNEESKNNFSKNEQNSLFFNKNEQNDKHIFNETFPGETLVFYLFTQYPQALEVKDSDNFYPLHLLLDRYTPSYLLAHLWLTLYPEALLKKTKSRGLYPSHIMVESNKTPCTSFFYLMMNTLESMKKKKEKKKEKMNKIGKKEILNEKLDKLNEDNILLENNKKLDNLNENYEDNDEILTMNELKSLKIVDFIPKLIDASSYQFFLSYYQEKNYWNKKTENFSSFLSNTPNASLSNSTPSGPNPYHFSTPSLTTSTTASSSKQASSLSHLEDNFELIQYEWTLLTKIKEKKFKLLYDLVQKGYEKLKQEDQLEIFTAYSLRNNYWKMKNNSLKVLKFNMKEVKLDQFKLSSNLSSPFKNSISSSDLLTSPLSPVKQNNNYITSNFNIVEENNSLFFNRKNSTSSSTTTSSSSSSSLSSSSFEDTKHRGDNQNELLINDFDTPRISSKNSSPLISKKNGKNEEEDDEEEDISSVLLPLPSDPIPQEILSQGKKNFEKLSKQQINYIKYNRPATTNSISVIKKERDNINEIGENEKKELNSVRFSQIVSSISPPTSNSPSPLPYANNIGSISSNSSSSSPIVASSNSSPLRPLTSPDSSLFTSLIIEEVEDQDNSKSNDNIMNKNDIDIEKIKENLLNNNKSFINSSHNNSNNSLYSSNSSSFSSNLDLITPSNSSSAFISLSNQENKLNKLSASSSSSPLKSSLKSSNSNFSPSSSPSPTRKNQFKSKPNSSLYK